jgi:predicted membrane protein DUF2306
MDAVEKLEQPRSAGGVPPVRVRLTAGWILAMLLCAMTLSVFVQVEFPLLLGMDAAWSARIRPYERLLHLHAICGVVALLTGATQFSSALRRGYPRLHRRCGYWYVATTAAASPIAIWVAMQYTPPAEAMAHVAQAAIWMFTTVAALIAILSHHPATHQFWMAHSYALTLSFVLSRFITEILNVHVPANAGGNSTLIWLLTLAVLLVADSIGSLKR